MDVFNNTTAMRSGAEAAEHMEAIQKNNAAIVAKRAGRYDEAIRLHSEAVQAKVRLHGERSIHAALSFNNLGKTYLKVGRLDEAADALAKALVVRDDKAFGGMELGPRNDAAASRDNMARVLEARGDFPGACELRLKGADKGHTMCGCVDVSFALRTVSTVAAGHGLCENLAKQDLLANYSVCLPEVPCCPVRS
ncbi:hypothetical protein FJTKL_00572 [Diaporthe vaccinii]|uniref:Uncharacterized protein n=1 Tax=Diaporthe vaccinii TaxID=105482 RepID=A0ABR4F5S5_9PEZI